jgi:hypothetical protein
MRNAPTALKPQALGHSAVFSPRRGCVPKTAVRLELHNTGAACRGHIPEPQAGLLVGRELGEGVWRGLFKACEPAAKDKTYFVRGPVALLGDLDFSLIALFRRGVHF